MINLQGMYLKSIFKRVTLFTVCVIPQTQTSLDQVDCIENVSFNLYICIFKVWSFMATLINLRHEKHTLLTKKVECI